MSINKNLASLVIICCFTVPVLSIADTADDAKITTQAKAKLMLEKEIPAAAISVKTQDGVVFLTGTVASETQADSAIKTVESIDEVKDVDASNLQVSDSNKPLIDSYITAKVKGMLLRKSFLGDQPASTVANIKVETKNGVVYLSGTVADSSIEQNAIETAKQVKGVTNVVSVVKVK